jgi:hypothetical protein
MHLIFSMFLFISFITLAGRVAEQMGDLEHALSAYENALRHNPMSLSGLTQVAGIARIKENYPKACPSSSEPRHILPESRGFRNFICPCLALLTLLLPD